MGVGTEEVRVLEPSLAFTASPNTRVDRNTYLSLRVGDGACMVYGVLCEHRETGSWWAKIWLDHRDAGAEWEDLGTLNRVEARRRAAQKSERLLEKERCRIDEALAVVTAWWLEDAEQGGM